MGRAKSRPDVKIKSPLVNEEKEVFKCSKCGKVFTRQKGNFPASNSVIYAGNARYLTTCNHCINELYLHYAEVLDDEFLAIRRVCMKFDIYFNDALAESSKNISADRPRMGSYIAKSNLKPHNGKTYDDTLDEEARHTVDSVADVEQAGVEVSIETLRLFGAGYTPEELLQLEAEFEDWIAQHECKSKAQREVFKNLAIAQLNISRATQLGDPKKVESAMTTFNQLLGTANLKPSQIDQNALADKNTFGTLIKRWEDEKPIPEPDEEFKDVDGIRHYITVWFLGALCHMVGIKNSYAQLYDEEIKRHTVEPPEYFDDDVRPELDNAIGGAVDGG